MGYTTGKPLKTGNFYRKDLEIRGNPLDLVHWVDPHGFRFYSPLLQLLQSQVFLRKSAGNSVFLIHRNNFYIPKTDFHCTQRPIFGGKNHGFRTSFPHGRIDSWLPSGDLACGYHQWNLPIQFDDGNHIEVLISRGHLPILYPILREKMPWWYCLFCPDDIPVYGHVDGLNPYSINHKYPLVKQWLMVKQPLNPHVPIISPDFLHCSRASPSAIAPASCSRHELHGLEYHPRKVSEPEIHGGWMQHLRIQHVYLWTIII